MKKEKATFRITNSFSNQFICKNEIKKMFISVLVLFLLIFIINKSDCLKNSRFIQVRRKTANSYIINRNAINTDRNNVENVENMINKKYKFDNVNNFRETIGYNSNSNELSNINIPIYRSAAFDNATSNDVKILLDDYKIATIIDLRNQDEIINQGMYRSFDGASKFYDKFSTAPSPTYPRKMLPDYIRYEIPLLSDLASFWEAVQLRSIKDEKERLYFDFLWCFRGKELMKILSQRLASGGFPLLYTIMLDISSEKIGQVLLLTLISLEMNKPVVFHCAQGKDRTGIIAMLIEYIVYVDEELQCSNNVQLEDVEQMIIQNYAISELLLPADKKDILGDGKGIQADDGNFISKLKGSPASAMIGTLSYIKENWGSVLKYLDYTGFNKEKRNRLRRICSKYMSSPDNNTDTFTMLEKE